MFKKSLQLVSIIAVTLALGACAAKKTVSDAGADTQATPAIDSTPMSFDAAGSDSGKIDGLTTVYFGYDKSALSTEAKATIKGNASWMKSHEKTSLQIEGHCDARGSIEYNLSLGERRAQAVKAYMVSLGIPAARLSVISYGKEKPLVQGDSAEAYAKNRRANFVPLAQ